MNYEQVFEGFEMSSRHFNLAAQYSAVPAGRNVDDGPNSGERFRDEYLIPMLEEAVRDDDDLVIELDGIFSISSSFLEEAFGGLVRTSRFNPDQLNRLKVVSSSRLHEWAAVDAIQYVKDEIKRKNRWF